MNKKTWPIDPKAPKEIKVKASHEGATMIRLGGMYNSKDSLILNVIREGTLLMKK